MTTLTILDPSLVSDNIGDEIIFDSSRRVLSDVFPNHFSVRIPTHERILKNGRKFISKATHSFVAGSNLLSSNMEIYNQWKIDLRDALWLKGCHLLGVGWWQYQGKPTRYTTFLLRRVLSATKLHSVRDTYTKDQLERAGISNVIVTGCPTLWELTPEHCSQIRSGMADAVVMTLTDYMQAPAQDQTMVQTLLRLYGQVFFWPQGTGDAEYLQTLGVDHSRIITISPNLMAFDALLRSSRSLDYVGTRLHGGIRAIQHKFRTLILSVDNRASEMRKDFNLPVVERTADAEALTKFITDPLETRIQLPQDQIEAWKRQWH